MDFLSDQASLPPLEAKPVIDRSGNVITVTNNKTGGKEDKLSYAYDGAPSLPLRWTYAQQARAVSPCSAFKADLSGRGRRQSPACACESGEWEEGRVQLSGLCKVDNSRSGYRPRVGYSAL